jgi:hypothetical protein
VPVDTRLRCCEVSAGWCDFLATERSLWTALDVSPSSGVTHAVTDALLRCAAAKAGGALTALDVSGCEQLSHAALLDVLNDNADSLLELRMDKVYTSLNAAGAEVLLSTATRLQRLVSELDDDMPGVLRVLSGERVFEPLRLTELCVYAVGAADAQLRAFAAAVAAYALSPLFSGLKLTGASLDAPGALDAVVDAVLANSQVHDLRLTSCRLSPASVPSLARLLGGSALTSLSIYGQGVQLLDAPAAALLGGALRTNGALHSLSLRDVALGRDGYAAMALLTSLIGHPSLREVDVAFNEVGPAHAACVGAALSALVAANAPALQTLDVCGCELGDAGLRPLFDALPRNSHLRALYVSRNSMSEAFARDVLLPAVRANTSLTELDVGGGGDTSASEAEQFVTRRAAARS